MSRLLEVQNLSVSYGAIVALRSVTLDVAEGEAVAILGANGAGKSTLLKALSGLLKPASGRIRFDGEDITGLRPAQLVKRGIVHVPEGHPMFSRLTVLSNLRMGHYVRRRSPFNEREAEPVFDLFPQLASRKEQLAGTLSGGEQQMLAIGRALMAQPRLFMLDEPSMGLSPRLVKTIFEGLHRINIGATILIVEQNVRAALTLAHRGYLLEAGEIILAGPSEVLTDESIRASYLGAESNLPDQDRAPR